MFERERSALLCITAGPYKELCAGDVGGWGGERVRWAGDTTSRGLCGPV